MKSFRRVLVVVTLMPLAGACSQSGPNLGGGMGGAGGGMAGVGGAMSAIDRVTGTPNDNGDSLKNSWMMFPCYKQNAQDCETVTGIACPNQNQTLPFEQQGLQIDQSFTVGGDPGVMYNVTFQMNGITEGKYYENGVRADGDLAPPNTDPDVGGINTFYTGGDPVNVENYNVYKLTVLDTDQNEIQHYYLNSMPKVATPFENHDSFPLGYTAVIPVMGGGTIQYHQADRNCRAIDNCGPGFHGASCGITAGRNIPNEPDVVIPSSFLGTPIENFNMLTQGTQPFHAQILHLTVTAVDVAPSM